MKETTFVKAVMNLKLYNDHRERFGEDNVHTQIILAKYTALTDLIRECGYMDEYKEYEKANA